MDFKLGKLPAKIDKRTIKLKSILRKLPPFPDRYDIDISRPVAIPYRMFLNNVLGNCVVVTKMNWILRAEAFEQKKVVEITDEEVRKQYFKETGGPDSGLYMLDSIKDWRNNGITLGERKLACLRWGGEIYTIYAFAGLNPGDPEDIKACVLLLNGPPIGLLLPQSALDAFDAGKPWEEIGGQPHYGHAVECNSYNEIGPQYLTWGMKVQATWAFHDKYCDEGYACVDNRNAFTTDSPVDINKLNGYLAEITG